MKNKFLYNEIEYAKYVEEHGFYSRYHKSEVKLLAKYWKSIGIKPKQRKEKLYDFCQKHMQNFERETHYKFINSVIAYSNKKTSIPIVIKSIPVYRHEFEFLNNLPVQEPFKKLLFTILVEKRIKKQINSIINNEEVDLKQLSPYLNIDSRFGRLLTVYSKIPAKYKIDYMLYELNQTELISVTDRELVKLNYIEQLNEVTSEVLIEIKSFESHGYYYDLLCGDKKISFCEDCGVIIKRTSNRKTRCNDCNEQYRREYMADLMKKKRESVSN